MEMKPPKEGRAQSMSAHNGSSGHPPQQAPAFKNPESRLERLLIGVRMGFEISFALDHSAGWHHIATIFSRFDIDQPVLAVQARSEKQLLNFIKTILPRCPRLKDEFAKIGFSAFQAHEILKIEAATACAGELVAA